MTAWRFLFISLTIHLLIWLYMLNQPSFRFSDEGKSVDVTLVEKENKKEKFVVPHLPAIDNLKPSVPVDSKFLSDTDQAVKKETRSAIVDKTQNGNSTFNSPDQKRRQQQQEQQKQDEASGDVGPKHNLIKFAPGPPKDTLELPTNVMSAANDIPDSIAKGSINSLNSERFTYYSFFSRIEENFYPRWSHNLEMEAGRLPLEVQKRIASHTLNSVMEVLLDSEGHYLETNIVQSCGVPEIDRAFVEAFAAARFFPNPPPEMVKADKKIHLNFQVSVQMAPPGWNRPSL